MPDNLGLFLLSVVIGLVYGVICWMIAKRAKVPRNRLQIVLACLWGMLAKEVFYSCIHASVPLWFGLFVFLIAGLHGFAFQRWGAEI